MAFPPLPPGMAGFPAAGAMTSLPALFTERGFFLRGATRADLPWLCRLYASTRAEEMAGVPWPETMKQGFLANQFALQHAHYIAHYGDSDFWIVDGAQGPVGRYYLQRRAPDHLIVDISFMPAQRGHGLGRALIAASQREAQSQGCGMDLHVAHHNPGARRLYERLGFVAVEDIGTHMRMRWSATAE